MKECFFRLHTSLAIGHRYDLSALPFNAGIVGIGDIVSWASILLMGIHMATPLIVLPVLICYMTLKRPVSLTTADSRIKALLRL